MRQSMRVWLALLLLIGIPLVTAWGQEVTAAIVGSVVDPSGAPIKGAAIVARDTERGVLYTAQTNDAGALDWTLRLRQSVKSHCAVRCQSVARRG
jgi:carboxypeptidase family protein